VDRPVETFRVRRLTEVGMVIREEMLGEEDGHDPD
jgi:hypothetical protein